jgi:hypothetical protein
VFFSSLLAVQLLSSEVHAETPEAESVPSAWAMVSPFGVPQFLNDRKGLGFTFGGLQLLGLGGAVYSGLRMVDLAEDGEVDAELRMRTLSAWSVGTAGAAWLASVIDGSHARDVALEKAHAARSWEAVQGRSFEVSGISGPRP